MARSVFSPGATVTLRARPATPDDYPTYARLFPELGTGDPVPAAATWTAELRPTTRIYELAGLPVAYSYHERMRELAYVRNVVVDPGMAPERAAQARDALLAASPGPLLAITAQTVRS